MKPKLLAIDGLGMWRRVYNGVSGANQEQSEVEKAAATFTTMQHSFRRALREHEPTHCLFAFDAGGETWRHKLYPPYKAGRQPMSAELQEELAKYKQSLAAEGWAQAEHPGHEADDTLSSVAFSALAANAAVVVLASDKDIASAAQYGAKVYDHFTHEWHDSAWCWKKFGVGLDRLQDWLALVGDSVDGVPGVPGVGDKTATRMLREHGDLDGVLAAAAALKGKIGANLRDEAETARLSRQLTALRVDLFPAGLDWDSMRVPNAARH